MRHRPAVTEGLARISVGIEHIYEIIAGILSTGQRKGLITPLAQIPLKKEGHAILVLLSLFQGGRGKPRIAVPSLTDTRFAFFAPTSRLMNRSSLAKRR